MGPERRVNGVIERGKGVWLETQPGCAGRSLSSCWAVSSIPGRWDQQCKGPGAVPSCLGLQTAVATGRVSQAREDASCPSGLITVCKDAAFIVGRALLRVYLQVHSDGHWEKGPGTPWESPEEVWAVRYGRSGHRSRVPSPALVVCGDSKLPLDWCHHSLGTKTSAVAIGSVSSS